MIIVTNKTYKRDRALLYTAAGVSGAIGITGTTIGAIALSKASKVRSELDHIHTEMERRMAAEEGMSLRFTKSIAQLQDVLEDNDLLRPKRR